MNKFTYLFLLLIPTSFLSCKADSKEPIKVDIPVSLGDPFIMLYNNVYYAYGTSADDGIEVYTSDDLEYWTKAENLVGAGHSATFKDKSGKLRIVFHAHHSKESIHPRGMYISEVTFTNYNIPVMKISDEIVKAKIKRQRLK